MAEEKQSLEVSGETVEAALESGLAQLGLSREQVAVEIIDEGRRGFLGMGNREAVLRLTAVETPDTATESETAGSPESETTSESENGSVSEQKGPAVESETPPSEGVDDLESLPDPELLEEEEVAAEITRVLMQKMGYDVTVTSGLSEPDDLDKQVAQIDIEGEDLGDLIGKRGETLATLQFLIRLMVSQRLRRRVDFLIDINGYRKQREEGLARLAHRMAGKVVKRNQPVTLEPMSSYERRLIHIALRNHGEVYTRSVGEGRERRVRIWPKKE